jgi:hypothetical protein
MQLLAQVLDFRIRDDQEFAERLNQLVAEAQEAGAMRDIRDAGAVAGEDFYQIGIYNAGRDQTITNKPGSTS